MDATVLKVVISLKRLTLSLLVGRFPCSEKMMSLISPEIEDFIHWNIAFAFWITLLFTRALKAVVMSASVTE